jgi:hypothetical protein
MVDIKYPKHMWLWRFPSTIYGTFGVLLDGFIPFCVAIEREWRNNQKNVSCFPDGDYVCQRVLSPKFGDTFEITNIPNRTHCLFHKGNIDDDSHGCVILGEQYESVLDSYGVVSSGKAFKEFLDRTKDMNSFMLHVRWVYH